MKDSLVKIFYERHHIKGSRLGQSVDEKVRADIFKNWIGINKKVLDLGGRDGTLSSHFSTKNDVTIGDADTNALNEARRRHGLDTIEVNLNEKLPLDDCTFDVVIMGEVIEHLPYPTETLGEVTRIIKQNGLFIGSLPLAYHLIDRWKVIRGKKLSISGDPSHLQFFKYEEAITLLSDFFEIDDIFHLKGGRKAEVYPHLFSRNICFKCRKI